MNFSLNLFLDTENERKEKSSENPCFPHNRNLIVKTMTGKIGKERIVEGWKEKTHQQFSLDWWLFSLDIQLVIISFNSTAREIFYSQLNSVGYRDKYRFSLFDFSNTSKKFHYFCLYFIFLNLFRFFITFNLDKKICGNFLTKQFDEKKISENF